MSFLGLQRMVVAAATALHFVECIAIIIVALIGPRIIPETISRKEKNKISTTAYVTGQTWQSRGLSDLPFFRPVNLLVYWAIQFPVWLVEHYLLGGPSTIDQFIGRHTAIDEVVREEIESGRVSVILELASGVSGRGIRYARKFPNVTYIETDLPDIAAHKEELISRIPGPRPSNHHIFALDALGKSESHAAGGSTTAPSVPHLLGTELSDLLSRTGNTRGGILILAEGLIQYMTDEEARGFFGTLVQYLSRRGRRGVFVTDCWSTMHYVFAHPEVEFKAVSKLFQYGGPMGAVKAISGKPTSKHDNIAKEMKESGFTDVKVHIANDLIQERRLYERYPEQRKFLGIIPLTTVGMSGATGWSTLWINVVVGVVEPKTDTLPPAA